MPWGEELPLVTDDMGLTTEVGPANSILAGVELQNPVAIAVVAVVAYLEDTNQPYTTFEGLNQSIADVPEARAAGRRVVHLQRNIRSRAGLGDNPPLYYDIINSALIDPEITPSNYENNTVSMFGTDRGRPRAESSERIVELATVDVRRDATAQTPSQPNWHVGSLRPECSASSHPIEGMDEEEWRRTERKNPTDQKKNRPPPPGDWEFVPGTDLSDPILGQPDPSKFFLLRQKKSNPEEKDCRQLPGWATFDWNDPDDIEHLKKHRSQIRNRTSGSIAVHRPPWTQMEYEVLKELVQNALNAGATKKTIDWEKIAKSLKNYFKARTQFKGAALAQTSRLIDNKLVYKHKKAKVLNSDRVGDAGRHAKSVEAQALKYADILELLLKSLPGGKGGKHRAPTSKRHQRIINTKEKADTDSNATSSSEEELPQKPPRKKQKQEGHEGPRDDVPKGPKKPPGPPPPAGGAGGLAGPMGKAPLLDFQRTRIPGH
jgi:hypothetical protein